MKPFACLFLFAVLGETLRASGGDMIPVSPSGSVPVSHILVTPRTAPATLAAKPAGPVLIKVDPYVKPAAPAPSVPPPEPAPIQKAPAKIKTPSCLGLLVYVNGERIMVRALREDSSAARLGLRMGDEIMSVDGLSLKSEGPELIERINHPPAETMVLVWRRSTGSPEHTATASWVPE